MSSMLSGSGRCPGTAEAEALVAGEGWPDVAAAYEAGAGVIGGLRCASAWVRSCSGPIP